MMHTETLAYLIAILTVVCMVAAASTVAHAA